MSYSAEAYAYANEVLEKRKEAYALRSMDLQNRIRNTVPGFRDAERERRSLGILRMRAKLSKDTEETERLSKGLSDLNARIDSMLTEYGFSKKDLEEAHFCSRCGDTGILPDGSMCECKKELLSEYELKKINSVSPLALCSFDNFRMDMYSDETDPEFEMSPRENMKYILERCRHFTANYPNGRSLLMMGSAGLGKTHLALSIADTLLKQKTDVVYCSCSNIFGKIEEEKSDYSRHSDTLDRLKSCSLLVLDDLGSEYVTNQVRSLIYDIVNSRLSSSLPTIVTTNYTEERQLKMVYGEKLSSRLLGSYELLPFFGDDIRQLDSPFT